GTLSAPIAYAELARSLGVELGSRAPLADVRSAVVALRASKGMVLDDADHDTWSAGSFFTNPVLPADLAHALPAGAPRYPVRSAAPASTTGPSLGAVDPGLVKHSLALTNRGSGTTAELVELARRVRDGVRDAFGVELVPEPVLVGVIL
ncbi:MAG TPA: UDP-N-acetylenolpyruvoylglucosamine reductase, partial [Actinotalea sp.]|nr:UDP-N-acetylenolpyruvoylglucosamine reductase [Actinotalea sp.]